MTSWRARALIAQTWLKRTKRFFANPAVMRKMLPQHQAPQRSTPPRHIVDTYEVGERVIDGHSVYTIEPRNGPTSPWHIVHLHGGGFVEAPAAHHWQFAATMVDLLGCTYTMPMYPLAPEHDHRTILPMIERTYAEVTDEVAPSNRIVFGDSAGGTLALTLARRLREHGREQPAALALFSPWIDLATDDPLSQTINNRDPELGVNGLKQAGRWYAGHRALDDPEISPAFADLTGIAPAIVFIGHRDILLPDARRIRELGDAAGVYVELHEYLGMPHNWIMQNIPEAKQAIEQLLAFLRAPTKDVG